MPTVPDDYGDTITATSPPPGVLTFGGTPLSGHLDSDGMDKDVFGFGSTLLQAGGSYTFNITGLVLPALFVMDASGQTVAVGNHTVNFTPTATGQYYLKVTYGTAEYGNYQISAVRNDAVQPANIAPVAVNDAATVAEDAFIAGDVLTNDMDPDGTPLAVASVGVTTVAATGATVIEGVYGTLTIQSNGNYTYVAYKDAAEALDAGEQATESFTYVARDSGSPALTGEATLTFTITGVDDPEVFTFRTLRPAQTVAEFNSGIDLIQLEDKVFKKMGNSMLKGKNFAANEDGEATRKFAQIIYDTDDGKLYYDSDGTGRKKAVLFATLENAPELSRTDFDFI